MRIIMTLAVILPFLYWMASDGLKHRSRKIVLVPDLLYTLADSQWDKAGDGLDYKVARLTNSVGSKKSFAIHVWRFDPEKFSLTVVNQHKNKGSSIRAYREKADAVLAINGGFFGIEKGSVLKASGLVVAGGKQLSPYRKGAGSGLFYQKGDRLAIGWARQAEHYAPLTQALQVGPMVVDPGGNNGISRNDGKYARRSVLCQDFRGRFLVIVIDGNITLFETGKLLSASEKQGGLGCERALNLDGGPSTMLDYRRDGRSVHIAGRWPVVNALVLKRKVLGQKILGQGAKK